MSQTIANGITIEYEQFGSPGNETLILVRGLGTQMIDWHSSLLQGLVTGGLHVVIFDNRDVGLSQKFTESGQPNMSNVRKGIEALAYDLTDMADDVIGLMDALDITRAHVLGISMGGMIVQLVAARYPDRLLSMMSVMSSSGKPGLPPPAPAAQRSLMATPDPAAGVDGIIASTAEGLLIVGGPQYPESLEERTAIARHRYERNYNPEGVARQMAAVVRNGDRTALLKTIVIPTTVVHGEDDPLIPVACGEDTASSIPGSVMIVVPGMGHAIPKSLVPEFIDIVQDHCERVRHTK
ncbi:MAG: alpha/beta hydrolase [bacterium]|nr:alpha/beta hydrolase [Gammaproteobacteria bacterium]HIL98638.1 alpha/beta hydrolase [Pseudomonadales bacterium]